jgi:hypothetical protein
VSDTFTTRVEQPGGPVHTGSGDFYSYTVNVDLGSQEAPGRSPRRIADDHLRLLRRQFVDPPGMGMARRVLEASSTVILRGDPGSGRTTAACVLLYEVHQGAGIFRELLPGEEEGALTDPGLVGVGDRLLLNLAEADVSQWAQARRDLSALRKTVQEQQAHLVVVMPHDGALESHLQPFQADIARPPAMEVFRRHLRLHRIPYEEYRLPAPALDEFLTSFTAAPHSCSAPSTRRRTRRLCLRAKIWPNAWRRSVQQPDRTAACGSTGWTTTPQCAPISGTTCLTCGTCSAPGPPRVQSWLIRMSRRGCAGQW